MKLNDIRGALRVVQSINSTCPFDAVTRMGLVKAEMILSNVLEFRRRVPTLESVNPANVVEHLRTLIGSVLEE